MPIEDDVPSVPTLVVRQSGADFLRAGDQEERQALLVDVVQRLSRARSITSIQEIVRSAARQLMGADGATFILREGSYAFYADEDAVGPLWKGQRFEIDGCVSGWAILNKKTVALADVYAARVPLDAYHHTFVKGLVIVPIREDDPLGAIGTYWAQTHDPTVQEIALLQALAESTAIAIENVTLVADLEARVRSRTSQLEAATKDLESFSQCLSHDLRAPLRSIDGFAAALEEDASTVLDPASKEHLQRIRAAAARMNGYIEDLLALLRVTNRSLERVQVDLTRLAQDVVDEIAKRYPARRVVATVHAGMKLDADPILLRTLLENLIGNAFKFTGKVARPTIEIGRLEGDASSPFYVRDNGAGFDMKHAGKLFGPFQRLHAESEVQGNGVGLATAQRIVRRHGGRIWADAMPGQGATFFFTLV